MSTVIPRNTPVPVQMSHEYTTVKDYQASAGIDVYQGERKLVRDNVKLGGFVVHGLISAPRGQSKCTVTFKLDEDGILEVQGIPRPGAPPQVLRITDPCDLPDSEIQRMVSTAADMHANDQLALERVKVRNELYFACYDYRNDARIGRRCQATLKWLQEFPDAPVGMLKDKLDRVFY